jgi:CRP/FNR family transcriptional regulator
VKRSEELKQAALFQGLPETQLEEVRRIALSQTYRKGQTLFLEGQRAAGFHLVRSGRIKIFKLSAEGKEQVLHIFGTGEVFGEVPVFAGEDYPAHAEALEESQVLFFPRGAFVELIQREPSLALNMLAILSLRLRVFTRLIEDLSLKEVPQRLAAYLLYVSERNDGAADFDLDIPKQLLANVLGTLPETLSRVFNKMSTSGFIRVEGRRIRILDMERLSELATGMQTTS